MSGLIHKWVLHDIEDGELEGVTELVEDYSGYGRDMIYNGWKKMCLQIAEDHGRQPTLESKHLEGETDLDKPFIVHTMKFMGTDTIIGTLEVFYK
jgi:hypothetical protein